VIDLAAAGAPTTAFRGVAAVPRACGLNVPTQSATVTMSVSATASGTQTNVPSPSLRPSGFTTGNVLATRVENVAGQLLSRVWVDEYSWNTETPAKPAKRVQSMHFPHRSEYVSPTATSAWGIDKSRLTLPFYESRTLGLGQITNSMDRCAIGVGGFDVGVNDVATTTLFPPSDRSYGPNPTLTGVDSVITLQLASSATTFTITAGATLPASFTVGSSFTFASLGLPTMTVTTSVSPATTVVAGVAAAGTSVPELDINTLYYVCSVNGNTFTASDALNLCGLATGITTPLVTVKSGPTPTISGSLTASVSDGDFASWRVGDIFNFHSSTSILVDGVAPSFTKPYVVCSISATPDTITFASITCASPHATSGAPSAAWKIIRKSAGPQVFQTTAVSPSIQTSPPVSSATTAQPWVHGDVFQFLTLGTATGAGVSTFKPYFVCLPTVLGAFTFSGSFTTGSASYTSGTNGGMCGPLLSLSYVSGDTPTVSKFPAYLTLATSTITTQPSIWPMPGFFRTLNMGPMTADTTRENWPQVYSTALPHGLTVGSSFYFASLGSATPVTAVTTDVLYFVCSTPSPTTFTFADSPNPYYCAYNSGAKFAGTPQISSNPFLLTMKSVAVQPTNVVAVQPTIVVTASKPMSIDVLDAAPVESGMPDISPYTAEVVSTTISNVITTSIAHSLQVGSAFYFQSVGAAPRIAAVVDSTTLYYVCSVISATAFTFANTLSCASLMSLTSLTFVNDGLATPPSTRPTIAVPAYYAASKNSVTFISGTAGSGFLTSQYDGFKGYRLSIARMSGRGWNDFFPNTATTYDHWLPKNKWYASDVYMTSWADVPRSVALSNVNTVGLSTIHANEVFYATGYTSATAQIVTDYNDKNSFASSQGTSAALPKGSAGSIRGRCFKGVSDYVTNNYDNKNGAYSYSGMTTADGIYGTTAVGFSGTTSTSRVDQAFLTSGSCTLSGRTSSDRDDALPSLVPIVGSLGVSSTSTTTSTAQSMWTSATAHNMVPGTKFAFSVLPSHTTPANFVVYATTLVSATPINTPLTITPATYYYVCSTPSLTTFTFSTWGDCASTLITWSTPYSAGPPVAAPVAPTTQFQITPYYLRAADSTAGCMSPFYAFKYDNGYKCATTTTKVGCQCFASDFVTVDPGNDVGTTGFCFVGPSSSSELRLLSVRPKEYGAIYGWPQGPSSSNNLDTTYIPSLLTSDYTNLGAGYIPTSISITNAGATQYGGASYRDASKLRNCAGRTASANVAFDTQSAVFWVEFGADDGFAVARSDYTSGFAQPYPVWKQGATVNTIAGNTQVETYPPTSAANADNAIVGVTYYQWDGSTTSSAKQDVVYVTSTTAMYASINAFTTAQYGAGFPAGCGAGSVQCLRDVKWYIIHQIGISPESVMSGSAGSALYGSSYKGSEYRGVAYAPRACAATGATFRALSAPEAEDEEAHV